MRLARRAAATVALGAVALGSLTVACGSDDEAADDAVPATVAESSDEAEPGDQDDAGDLPDGAIEVVFDGSDCSTDVSAAVTSGTHSFVLTDRSDLDHVEMWVRNIAEGHSYDDLLAAMRDAGGPGVYFAKPEFVGSTPLVAPAASLGDDGTHYQHLVEPGTYAFVVADADDLIWLCGSFEVVDA